MQIHNNILRRYLENCYFINGTACAGKSTLCRLLAEKYGMLHMEENYNMDGILETVTQKSQPELNYFLTMESWQAYVQRPPEEFERWMTGVSREVQEFEIAHLIHVSQSRKVIVDTNIPVETLREISHYNRVAILLSPMSLSVHRFFDRGDPEKNMLLREIQKTENPRQTLENFRRCIARVNSPEHYAHFQASGFFTLTRGDDGRDTREEMLQKVARHFLLDADCDTRRVLPGTPQWAQLTDFSENAPCEFGKHLAVQLREYAFTDFESVFAAFDGSEIIGFATLLKTDYYPENRYGPWISSIFVSPDRRGRRISGKLIQAAEACAAKNGFTRVYIPSGFRGLYEKYGYAQIDTLTNYAGASDYIFEKQLAE